MGAAGVLIQRRLISERRREARCSFCGVYSPSGVGLERAPRFQGAAICPRCAAIIAKRYGATDDEKLDPAVTPIVEVTKNGSALHAKVAAPKPDSPEPARPRRASRLRDMDRPATSTPAQPTPAPDMGEEIYD